MLQLYLSNSSEFLKTHSSQLEACSVKGCDDDLHKMRQQYMNCHCCKECDFKYKVKLCEVTDHIELFRSIAPKCLMQSKLAGTDNSKKRGIDEFIKIELIKMMKYDSDLTPKRALTKLILKRKKQEEKGESTFDCKYIPSLDKVNFFNWS